MKIKWKNIFFALLLIGAVAAAAPEAAVAANTASGTAITNSVTLDYEVNGVAQTQKTASVTFSVDRKIIFTVVASNKAGGTEKSASPNTPVAATNNPNVITYTVTNTGNTAQFFSATMTDTNSITGGGGVTYYWNTTGTLAQTNGVVTNATAYTPGDAINSSVAAGGSLYLYAVIAVPAGAQDTETRDIAVAAVSIVDGATNTPLANGGVAGSGTAVVIAMGGGTDGDNLVSDTGRFLVAASQLTLSKGMSVYSDPIHGVTGPKAIPGAVVTYIVTITNGSATTSATNIVMNDNLDAEIDAGRIAYNTSYTGYKNDNTTVITCASPGVLVDDTCNTGASWDGTGNIITVTGLSVGPSSSKIIKYNVTIQ